MAGESPKNLTLVCIDASEHSKRALEWYFNTIHQNGDDIGLVHVHNPPDFPVGMGLHAGELLASDLYQEAVKQSLAATEAVVEKYKKACEDRGVTPKVFKESVQDSIGNTICEIAKKCEATLIVIGQRGLGAIRRTLFGSVSDYVLHHTHIPVVVVPPAES
ncbi:universal stress protein MT2085-like [Hydractinia symbiolongicarpus]|uniref:universal stress protein MT2085-like n=1 Tax=Hydractinia symbiolongicarpus TaxID=13093 RepID=UPI00254D63D5|nr:universal stress protein MT2085-like [Hydractinia symbiolongicarpus]